MLFERKGGHRYYCLHLLTCISVGAKKLILAVTIHLHNRRLKHIKIHSESHGQSEVDPNGPRLIKLCLE